MHFEIVRLQTSLVTESLFVNDTLVVRDTANISSTEHYAFCTRAVFAGWRGDEAVFYRPDDKIPDLLWAASRTADEARGVFARRRSVADLIDAFNLRRRDVPRFLAGIDVILEDEICRNRSEGMSLASIAKLHKAGVAKVRRILKERGFEIRPGNTLKSEPSRSALRRAQVAGKSVNMIATEYGIHWQTAKRRLDALGKSDT